MSAEDGSISLAFGDGEYVFRIAFGQWHELLESVNKPRVDIGLPPVGPMDLLRLLGGMNAWPNDVREIIRLGLIGGGMKSDRALVLIKRYVETAGPLQNSLTAAAILQRAMWGPPDDTAGKEPTPAVEPEPTAEMNASGLAPSTGSVLQ